MKNYILPFALGMSLAVLSRSVNVHARQQSDDRQFVKNALEDGLAEVMLANLALEESAAQPVRDFAEMIIADHQKANNQLKNIVKKNGYADLPDGPSPAAKENYERINLLTGTEFNKAFAKQMVADHEKAINVFQRQIDNGTDKELTAWAKKILPRLKKHLEQARKLDEIVNES